MLKSVINNVPRFFFSNADPSGKGSTKEWVEKLIIVGYPKAATSVHITGQSHIQCFIHIKIKSCGDIVLFTYYRLNLIYRYM